MDLNKINADWVYMPGRIPIPDWKNIVRASIGMVIEGYKEQSTFYYYIVFHRYA